MNYIQKKHAGYTFEPDYKQVFYNKWTLNIAHNELIKMKNNDLITDRDMMIVKYLFRFTFATEEMLFRLVKDDDKIETTRARLEKLLKSRVVNKFMLTKVDAGEIPDDAMGIYCLDVGGKTLLTHYSNEDTTNWYTTVNMKGSELISKDLITGNFYLKLMNTCPKKIKYFKQNPEYRIGRVAIVPSFEMGMVINGETKYFIGEVVRKYDYPMYFRDRISRLESILCTNAWKKYYHDSATEPVLFLFTEDDQNAVETAGMIIGTTEIKAFRSTTDARLTKELFEAGTFLRYDEETASLKAIKASTFDPDSV